MPATERINMAKVYINEKNKKGHINPELYGNFSEHLGRCIYEGLYVGENSEIPNTNGMRNDVVAALKEMKLSGASLARRLFRGRIPLERRYRTEGEPQENDQHSLGWCDRGQQLRYP